MDNGLVKKKFRLRKDRPVLWVRPVSLKRRRPFYILYRTLNKDYGMCYTTKRREDTISMYIPRRHKGSCGWNPDRHRFVCERLRGRRDRSLPRTFGWRKEVYG